MVYYLRSRPVHASLHTLSRGTVWRTGDARARTPGTGAATAATGRPRPARMTRDRTSRVAGICATSARANKPPAPAGKCVDGGGSSEPPPCVPAYLLPPVDPSPSPAAGPPKLNSSWTAPGVAGTLWSRGPGASTVWPGSSAPRRRLAPAGPRLAPSTDPKSPGSFPRSVSFHRGELVRLARRLPSAARISVKSRTPSSTWRKLYLKAASSTYRHRWRGDTLW